jgi:putative copper export protein
MSPSTPLGPFEDSIITWGSWVTLMGVVGALALAVVSGSVARRIGGGVLATSTARLARVALVLSILAVPAVLTDLAHGLDEAGGYNYGAAWDSLFDGTNQGRLLGLEVVLSLIALVLIAPLAIPAIAGGKLRAPLLTGAVAASAVALGTTRFPDEKPEAWGRATFDTGMWMLHLFGGAIWIGGLIGLLALSLAGAVPAGSRSSFWAPVIRRFSVTAMSCVAAICLSGLYLYWEHVDGPTQLFTTMYGRVLGVKILVFGTMLLLGMANQFWLHPKIEALRAAGDERPLRTILVREFRGTIAAEVVLGLSVLLIAPFLHGSARNQAFQASEAHHGVAESALTRIAPKVVSSSTWMFGTAETVLVLALMIGGYLYSGRIARARITAARVPAAAQSSNSEPALL